MASPSASICMASVAFFNGGRSTVGKVGGAGHNAPVASHYARLTNPEILLLTSLLQTACFVAGPLNYSGSIRRYC